MTGWHVPLADVVVPEEDIAAVADVYRSGWLSMGPRTEEFETALAAYTGARHAVAVANGTAALHLMCLAAGLGPGDEVVVPSMTFVATVNAIVYTGGRPVFADIAGLREPWLSAAAAEAAITPRTKAIMTVAYGGHPGEITALATLAERRGLILLEDAAHAVGARAAGRHLGRFGAAGGLSFFANKNLAIGEGGAVVTDDERFDQRVRLLRSHGMTALTWDRHRGRAAGYDVVALGFNYRLDEPRAALALRALARLDADNARRHAIDARYREALAGLRGVEPTEAPPPGAGNVPAHHLFTVVLEEALEREALRTRLADRGVQTSVHYPPAHRFALHATSSARLPVTAAYAARTLTLPLFPHMTAEQQGLVVEALGGALAGQLAVK
jgi:dTDP-4-amino-4,6-dideoxygalactose transaminase